MVCASGVYAIEHDLSGYRYIGSSVNIRNRWAGHRRELARRRHHCALLQTSWNVHEGEGFTLIVLECVADLFALTVREQYWIDATPNRFNTAVRSHSA